MSEIAQRARYHAPAPPSSTSAPSPLDRLRAAHRLPASALADREGGRTFRASVAVRKAVLLVLAERANGEGWSFLRVRTIATETGFTDRPVRDALDALEAAGWLTRERQHRDDGGDSCYAYRMDWDRVMAAVDIPRPQAVDNARPPGTRSRPPRLQEPAPPRLQEPRKKGVKNLKEEDLEGEPPPAEGNPQPAISARDSALRELQERDPDRFGRLLADAEYDLRSGNRVPSVDSAAPALRERILSRVYVLLNHPHDTERTRS